MDAAVDRVNDIVEVSEEDGVVEVMGVCYHDRFVPCVHDCDHQSVFYHSLMVCFVKQKRGQMHSGKTQQVQG